MTGWYNSSWRARFLEYRKEGDGWSHPLLLCDKTHRRRTMMSGDDRQNSPSISRQNRPSATQLFLRHIVEKDAFAQQRIVSVMLTDVKENGAVVFLGKLYNIIPGKKPFTRAFNSAPSAFSYTAVELPPYFSGNCPFICRILPIVLLA